jgi:hypothetical protein
MKFTLFSLLLVAMLATIIASLGSAAHILHELNARDDICYPCEDHYDSCNNVSIYFS